MPETMRLIDPDGITRDVALDAVPRLLADSRWRVPTAQDEASRLSSQASQEAYGGVAGGIKAGAAALARGATLGLSDVAARAIGGEDAAIALEGYRSENPGLSFAGELVGGVAPALVSGGAALPAGAAASLGRSAATAAGGGLRGALAAGAVEGGLAGVGMGASELALSRDPLTFERAAATLGSSALFGAGIGGALGVAANGVERGLHRAGAAIDDYAAREAVAPDLVSMDRKGLKLVEEAELARIEAERVGQRAGVADEIAAFRDDLKQQKIWLTTKKGADEAVPPSAPADAPSPSSAPMPAAREMPSQEFDDWRAATSSKMSPDELKAGDDYMGGAYGVNRVLRTGEVPDTPLVRNLDSLLEKSELPSDTVVTRGVYGDAAYDSLSNLKPGDDFVDKGYLSTSVTPDGAYGSQTQIDDAIAHKQVMMEISLPKGSKAAPIFDPEVQLPSEREILLPRNQRLTVKAVDRFPDGQIKRVHLEALAPNPKTSNTPAPLPSPSTPPTPPQIEGLGPLGKRLLKTDRALDRLLDNPKALADRPQRALDALQMQEAAYESILAKSDQLRIKFAADTSGDRIAALESIPAALERNRQLQQKIGALLQPPRTPRLDAIAEARDVLSQPAAPKGMVEQIFGGAAFGAVTSAVGSVPVLGQIPGVAAIIGAKGAELATRVVFGKMGASFGAQAERAGAIVKALTGAVKTAAPYAPVVATRTLAALRYGKDEGEQPKTLPALYKKRTDEIKQLTAYDETGTPRMRPAVREQLGRALRPIAAVDPILADRIETQKARGIEYLSSILPRRPDLPGVGDSWQPSELDMRSWARSAAAVEDPYGVLERAIHGAVTPEDSAVMRNVWPEMLAAFTGEVMSKLPELRATLPYNRQLALSILTGEAVTPAMDRKVMRVLQAQFPDEPGSAGGTQAPKAQPQFGSMRATTDQMTPSQSRVQGAV